MTEPPEEMMLDHDWHTFDAERGYEVRCTANRYEVRPSDRPDQIVELTVAEFEQLRQDGPSPKGLNG